MGQVASRTLARPPKPARAGKTYRLNFYVPGELVEAIDSFARETERAASDPDPALPEWAKHRPPVTRTEAVRMLLIAALKQHGLLK